MQIKQVKSEGLQKEFLCTIAAEDINKKINSKLEKFQAQAKLPGFRPGKVPLPLVKQRYGSHALSETLEKLCNEATNKALKDNNYRAATQPQIDFTNKYEEGKPLELKVNVEVLPEIAVKDFNDFNFERYKVKINDEDYKKALQNVIEGFLITHPVKRAAKESDVILMDYTFCLDGGEKRDYKDQKIALKSPFAKERLQGQLEGKKAGDTLTAVYTFPADFENAKLAEKSVEYNVTIKEVQEFRPPSDEEAIAKELHLNSAEDLKKDILSKMEDHYNQDAFLCLKRQILDKLADEYDFMVPFSMVQSEMDAIKHSVQQESSQEAGKEQKFSEEDLKKFEKIAERRVRLGLLLAEISRLNDIHVTDKELQHEVINRGRQHPQGPAGLMKYYEKHPHALEYLKAPILEDKVINFLLGQMTVTDKEVTEEELKKHFEKTNTDLS